MGYLRSGNEGSEGHLGTILRRSGYEGSEGHLRVISGLILVNSGQFWSYVTEIAFIWPWVGLPALNILVLGSREGAGWVPGIALPPSHPSPTTPGTPLPPRAHACRHRGCTSEVNMVVGLISVDQLT